MVKKGNENGLSSEIIKNDYLKVRMTIGKFTLLNNLPLANFNRVEFNRVNEKYAFFRAGNRVLKRILKKAWQNRRKIVK